MKLLSTKLKSGMKKLKKTNTKKSFVVKNAENTNLKTIKPGFMDILDQEVWDYMNEIDEKDLK